jgi:CheY-specific phosphatase CheX
MPVKFFGQFLLEKGIVTREALLKAVGPQDSTNLKFGEMARSMGLITDADIDRVHDAQRSEDLPFGDMCVKLGVLTADQMKAVLAKQKADHLFIGEALIKAGAINASDLPKYLDAFKADQAPYVIDRVAIPAGVPDAALWEAAADLTYKMLSRMASLTVRPGQCVLAQRLDANDTVVAIWMTGSVKARYLFSVSFGVRTLIARAMLNTDDVSKEQENMLNDTVMELANVICGHIEAKASQMGKEIEISPPEVLLDGAAGIPVPTGGKGLLFPLYVAEGRIEVGIFLEQP